MYVYKDPVIGKQLSCRKDRQNVHHVYAVTVTVVEGDAVARAVVNYVPWRHELINTAN